MLSQPIKYKTFQQIDWSELPASPLAMSLLLNALKRSNNVVATEIKFNLLFAAMSS